MKCNKTNEKKKSCFWVKRYTLEKDELVLFAIELIAF